MVDVDADRGGDPGGLSSRWSSEADRRVCVGCASERRDSRGPSAAVASPAPESVVPWASPELGGSTRLGECVLTRELGRGGMGVVYEAYDPRLRRRVAVKLMTGEADPERIARFQREALAAARLKHPGIVHVHRAGIERIAGRLVHYLVLAHCSGGTLERVASTRPGPGRESIASRVDLLVAVARAVGAAHGAGVVHRDLKPANVLFAEDGRPVVTDFGLALLSDGGGTRLTQSGEAVGTLHYMPPEQLLGQLRRVDARSDVWSLGVMLYELVTGTMPFAAPSAGELFYAIVEAAPVSPAAINPAVDVDLETIAMVAMSRERALRYADAGALADDLARWLRGEPIAARRPSWLVRTRRALVARPWAIGILVALALVGTCAAWVAVARAWAYGRLVEEAGRAEGEQDWSAARVAALAAYELRPSAILAGQAARAGRELLRLSAEQHALDRERREAVVLPPLARELERVRGFAYVPVIALAALERDLTPLLARIEGHAAEPALSDSARLAALEGEAWWLVGRLERARAAYARACARPGADRRAWLGLARAAMHRAWLARWIEPERAQAWRDLAGTAVARAEPGSGTREQALAACYAALAADRDPDVAALAEDALARFGRELGIEEIHAARAMARANDGTEREARRIAWEAHGRRRPRDPWRGVLVGVQAALGGDHDGAAAGLARLEAEGASSWWSHLALAEAGARLGRRDDAARAWSLAWAAPDVVAAVVAAREVEWRVRWRDVAGAAVAAGRAGRDDDDPMVALVRAKVARAAGDPAGARAIVEGLVRSAEPWAVEAARAWWAEVGAK